MNKSVELKHFVFEVTQKCNNDCIFCYNVWKCANYPSGELNTSEIKDLIIKLRDETDIKLLSISGGEPLIRKDIPEIIKFLSINGINSNLITNGSLLGNKKAYECIKSGVTLFEIQLLGAERSIHNRLTRTESFDHVIEGIKAVRNGGGKFIAAFVATKQNIKNIKETAELAIALDASGIMFNRFNPGGIGIKKMHELLPSISELDSALEVLNELARDYGISVSCSIPMQPCLIDMKKYKKIGHGYCPSGDSRSYYTVDSTGNVRVCNHSPTIIGDLKKQSLADILKHNFVEEFKTAIPAFCKGCSHEQVCRGGCKAASQVCYGKLTDNDPMIELNKSSVRKGFDE